MTIIGTKCDNDITNGIKKWLALCQTKPSRLFPLALILKQPKAIVFEIVSLIICQIFQLF